jgi:hypothetical protein
VVGEVTAADQQPEVGTGDSGQYRTSIVDEIDGETELLKHQHRLQRGTVIAQVDQPRTVLT